jgi:hypothetical protein
MCTYHHPSEKAAASHHKTENVSCVQLFLFCEMERVVKQFKTHQCAFDFAMGSVEMKVMGLIVLWSI